MMKKTLRTLVLALLLTPLACLAAGIDINAADAAELEQIKGIGPAKARAIIEYRDTHGPFARVADLRKVPGIGEKTLAQIRRKLTVIGDEAAPPAAR